MEQQLNPLPVSPVETLMMLGSVAAVLFTFFAIWKVHRHDWRATYALALVLLSFLVPFAGPVVALARAIWSRTRPSGPTAA